MRIFVAGATGAIGAHLVPGLVAAGHDVTGMTRDPSKAAGLEKLGARAAVADALDPEAVARAVAEAEPEVVIHQLTGLTGASDLRNPDRFMATTNRLRTAGTDHLLAAAQAIGVRRFIAQSYGANMIREGGPVKTESDPLDPNPPTHQRETVAAIRHVEEAVPAIDWAEGLVLRYGVFYGPGTNLSADPGAEMAAPIRKRQLPIIGGGTGVWSFVHIADAAAATLAAVTAGEPGIYNVADDEPVRASEWIPGLATALGAPAPLRVPRFVGRLLAGEAVTAMMTETRGLANAKAKRELGWTPRFASWRTGFREGLS